MDVVVNGVTIPDVQNGINVEIRVESGGETVPHIKLNVVDGRLDVNASGFEKHGDIHLHPLR